MTKFQGWSRSKRVVNADPQRRCYDGGNFSERIDYGWWASFCECESREAAERIIQSLRCERYEYEVRPA